MFSAPSQSLLSQTYIADRYRRASGSRRGDFGRVRRDRRAAYRFVRHYAEMVAVMFLGMYVLMAPAGWLLGAFGTSSSHLSPAMNTFLMAMTMTGPMVAWMRYRGHAWRPTVEMAASMLI